MTEAAAGARPGDLMDLLLQLRSLATLAVITLAALAIGAVAAKRLRAQVGGRFGQAVWETTLGLVVAGTLLAWLGIAGLLHAGLIAAATLVMAPLGVVRMRQLLNEYVPAESAGDAVGRLPAWFARLLVGGAIVAVVASLAAALAPPTAGDALCYHLELPKRFLEEHRLVVSPDDDNATYPLLAEMWFAWGLALDGPTTAQLMHWLCGLLLAGAAYLLAAPIVGKSAAAAAAAVVLLVPGVNNQMTAPLNDVALALTAAMALVAWFEARRSGTWRSFVAVGVLLGGALSVKYTALVFALVCGGVWLNDVFSDRDRRRALLVGGGIALVVAAAIAGPWYARAAWHRGDPLYPFFTAHAADAAAPSTFPERKTPLGRGPAALVAAPWQMTMVPERFGGRGHQLGPLFLMFVPCAAALLGDRRGRVLLGTAAAYGVGCVLLRQNVRFLFPLVPLSAAAVVAAWTQLGEWPAWPRRTAWCAATAIVLFLAVVPAARAVRHLPVAVGWESRADYLSRVEPTFAPAEAAAALLPADARLLSQEMRAFYFRQPLTRENIFRRRTGYDRTLESPGQLNARLRAAGFTHLLLAEAGPNESGGSPAVAYDATLSTLVERAIATSPQTAPRPIAEFHTCDADGNPRRYRLLTLR